jgi:hypothetical protein
MSCGENDVEWSFEWCYDDASVSACARHRNHNKVVVAIKRIDGGEFGWGWGRDSRRGLKGGGDKKAPSRKARHAHRS